MSSIASIQTIIRRGYQALAYKPKSLLSLLFIYFFVFSVDMAHAGILGGIIGTLATATAIVVLPGLLMWAAVSLFDVALSYTVFDFYKNVQGQGTILTAVKQIWITTRDLANILIIGAFVYIAIAKILSLQRDFRKQIVTLLSVAILINFSFFFALTAIDITNWLSVQIYNATIPTVSAPGESYGEIIVTNMQGVEMLTGMSQAFEKIGDTLAGIFTATGAIEESMLGSIAYFFLSLMLTLIGALLFFRLAFILIARFVSLFVLLALSALAFSAMLIPSLNKYWVSWRNGLLYNSIIAPVLLFLLYVITKILEVIGVDKIDANNIELGNGFAETILIFFVGMGLLWGAIRVATTLSNKAVDSMGGLGRRINGLMNWTQGLAGRGAFAGVGWAGRNTLGRFGSGLSGGLSSMADRTNNRTLRRGLQSLADSSALKRVASGSYDARQNKATQEFMKKAGMNVGSGVAQGFKQLADARKKQEEKHNKNQEKAREEAAMAESQGAITAAQAAKDEAARQQKATQDQIKAEQERLERMQKDNDRAAAQGADAKADQAKIVERQREAVEEIKKTRDSASNTKLQAEQAIKAETDKIASIDQEIKDIQAGTITVDNIELKLNELNQQKNEAEVRLDDHMKTRKVANTQLGSAENKHKQLNNNLNDAEAELRRIETEQKEDTKARNDAVAKQREVVGHLTDTHEDLQGEIDEQTRILQDYTDKFMNAMAQTRLGQEAKELSMEDKQWLQGVGVTLNSANEIVSAPSQAVLESMSKAESKRYNELLSQVNKHLKYRAEKLKHAGKTPSEIKKEEEAKKRQEAFMQFMDSNIADSLNDMNKPKKEDISGDSDKKE